MKYIESPAIYQPHAAERSLFLAGGITGCPNWQREIVQLLADADLALLNPRRENFPIDDPTAAEAQILWEYNYLRIANEILFWFPCETLCPIVLYELGAWSMTDKPLHVGLDPAYKRRSDVEIQTKLIRPNIRIVYFLYELVRQVKDAEG